MFLSGERVGRYGTEKIKDAMDFFVREKKSGYVRITEEREGLVDFYLIFLEGEAIGSMTEGEKIAEYGKLAQTSFLSKHENAIVETYTVSKKAIEAFFQSMPQVFFGKMKEEKESAALPKKAHSFRIAGAEIKPETLLKSKMSLEKMDFKGMIKEMEGKTGCMRLVCESEKRLKEGCIVSENGVRLAFYEDEETLFGERALIRIAFMAGKKGMADVYSLSKAHVEELDALFSASRIKNASRIENSEEYVREKARRGTTEFLGLRPGKPILSSPFSGAFSLEISMRTAEERNLVGYIWIEASPHFALLYFEDGRLKACLCQEKNYVYGKEAFEMMYNSTKEGMLTFYETPRATIKEQKAYYQMSKEEEIDILLRKVASEMGQDVLSEIKGAQSFKKKFAERRSEEDGVS